MTVFKSIWGFLAGNFVWKVLSLSFAVVIWFVVINYTNPLETGTFRIPLSIINEDSLTDNNFLIFNKPDLESTGIEVRIRAPRSLLAELSSDLSGVTAYIDLGPIDFSHTALLGEAMPITVRYSLPSNSFEVLRHSPDRVNIVLDRYVSRSFPISVIYIGDVPDGYSSSEAIIDPQTVIISGPRTAINDIASVSVTIDQTTITSTTSLIKGLAVYNDLNRDLTDRVNLSTDTAEVTLFVSKIGTVNVTPPNIIGLPAENFMITSVTHTPRAIEVVGDEDSLDNISDITLDVVISGISQTTEFSIDARPHLLANNLNVRNLTPHMVTVTVVVERLESKELTVSSDRIIAVGSALPFNIEDEYVQITIRGLVGALEMIDENNIDLYVDMSGTDIGVHQRQVHASLPVNVEIQGEHPTVTIQLGDVERFESGE